MGRKIGYLRVSTEEQGLSGLGLDAQEAALRLAHPDIECVCEVASGALRDRPILTAVLQELKDGQASMLAVAKLDRIARSATHVLDISTAAHSEGWDFVALDLGIDTTTTNGRLILTILAAIAEWERNTIRDRIKAALAAKKARGERLGRLPGLDPVVSQRVQEFVTAPEMSLRAISQSLFDDGVRTRTNKPLSPSTVRRYLRGLRTT